MVQLLWLQAAATDLQQVWKIRLQHKFFVIVVPLQGCLSSAIGVLHSSEHVVPL